MEIIRIGCELFADVVEGDAIDDDYWTDSTLQTITRTNKERNSLVIYDRCDVPPTVERWLNPTTFIYQNRMVALWQISSFYKDVESKWECKIPMNDHVYSDKEMEIHARRQ